MADTQRTQAAMLALLADNASGAISPQDLRDMFVSQTPSFGAMYISSAAATTITVQGTYYEAEGTTAALGNMNNFSMTADNQLSYTGTEDIECIVLAAFSIIGSVSNQVHGFKIAKNGTVIDESLVTRKIGTGTDVGAAICFDVTTLSTDDYVGLFCTNTDGTGTITLNQMQLLAWGVTA